MRILLVEDNDINMEVAEFQLTSQGAAVDKAWNGREAVERFAASAPGGYQAILMDVMMPVMDGFEASRAIRALDRPDAATVPILAMTAQASDECAQSCHRVGMNGRLVKPLDAKSWQRASGRLYKTSSKGDVLINGNNAHPLWFSTDGWAFCFGPAGTLFDDLAGVDDGRIHQPGDDAVCGRLFSRPP